MSACGAVSGSRDSSALDVSKHYDGSDHPFAPCRNVPHAARRGARRGSSDTVHTLGHARRTAHARHRVAMRVARHGHRRERKNNDKENETNRAENGTPGRSSLTRRHGTRQRPRSSALQVPRPARPSLLPMPLCVCIVFLYPARRSRTKKLCACDQKKPHDGNKVPHTLYTVPETARTGAVRAAGSETESGETCDASAL